MCAHQFSPSSIHFNTSLNGALKRAVIGDLLANGCQVFTPLRGLYQPLRTHTIHWIKHNLFIIFNASVCSGKLHKNVRLMCSSEVQHKNSKSSFDILFKMNHVTTHWPLHVCCVKWCVYPLLCDPGHSFSEELWFISTHAASDGSTAPLLLKRSVHNHTQLSDLITKHIHTTHTHIKEREKKSCYSACPHN